MCWQCQPRAKWEGNGSEGHTIFSLKGWFWKGRKTRNWIPLGRSLLHLCSYSPATLSSNQLCCMTVGEFPSRPFFLLSLGIVLYQHCCSRIASKVLWFFAFQCLLGGPVYGSVVPEVWQFSLLKLKMMGNVEGKMHCWVLQGDAFKKLGWRRG